MAEFAKADFALSRLQEDGHTLRDHLNAAWAASGRQPEQLAEAPPLPPQAAHVWAHFLDLHGSRGTSGFGPAPITFADLQAWQIVTRSRLEPWELKAVRRLDAIYLAEAAEAARKGAK